MNARIILRHLMSTRRCTFWGNRAFVTVAFPLALIPEPMPPEPTYGKLLSAGHWLDDSDPEHPHEVVISCWSGDEPDDLAGVVRGQDLELPARHWARHDYWQGQRFSGADQKQPEPLPREDVLAYARLELWQERWLHGREGWETMHPVLAQLHEAGAMYAKTTYAEVRHGQVFLTYSVKWRYHRRRHGICRELRRAFELADREGVRLRLCRG